MNLGEVHHCLYYPYAPLLALLDPFALSIICVPFACNRAEGELARELKASRRLKAVARSPQAIETYRNSRANPPISPIHPITPASPEAITTVQTPQ